MKHIKLMKPVLSICMMVKNEEMNLERCLRSLQPIMKKVSSELIIVDTGSTDRTVEIAQKYTDKVYFHNWNNNFSEMRNITISYSVGKWVFIIDADEELESVAGILSFFSKPNDARIAGAGLTVKNFADIECKIYSSLVSVRIFRRVPEFRYEGVVHNRPVVNGVIVNTGDSLLHYGYLNDDVDLMELKFKRTSKLLKDELVKDPQNIYYRFQLCVSYGMHNDWNLALGEVVRAYDLLGDDRELMKKHIYVFGGFLHTYIRNSLLDDEAITVGKKALEIEPDYLDIYYFLAQIYMKRKDYQNSSAMYLKYLELMENFDNISTRLNPFITHYSTQYIEEAIFNLAGVMFEEGDYKGARRNLWKIILELNEKEVFVKHAMELIIRSDIKEKDFQDTQRLFSHLVASGKYVELKLLEQNTEAHWKTLDADLRQAFCQIMVTAPEAYGVLNSVRYAQQLGEHAEFLSARDWNELPAYYAFLWMYSLTNFSSSSLIKYWSDLSEMTILEYCKYLDDVQSKQFLDICQQFLTATKEAQKYDLIRIRKNIAKYMLFSQQCEEKYSDIFTDYLQAGRLFLETLYGKIIIERELTSDLKNVEEAFLLYMVLAERSKLDNHKTVQYLTKALEIYPDMSKGIEIVLQSLKDKKEDYEMEQLTKQIIANVGELFEAERFDEALELVNECETIIGVDVRLLAYKTAIIRKSMRLSL